MKFVVSKRQYDSYKNVILLHYDNWDDFGYKTTFSGYYFDGEGNKKELGTIKIGSTEDHDNVRIYDVIPKTFTKLPDNYFSLWQSADSYEIVKDVEIETKEKLFKALNDICYDTSILEKNQSLSVMEQSLLRFVSLSLCQNQFHRITQGKEKLVEYSFEYKAKKNNYNVEDCTLSFQVIPESTPPTNIHVLIGRNGTGKTSIIHQMISDICSGNKSLNFQSDDKPFDVSQFESIVHIAFSPMDKVLTIEGDRIQKYCYIGIKKEYPSDGVNDCGRSFLLDELEKQFLSSWDSCHSNMTKKADLIEAIQLLNSDPAFAEYHFEDLDAVERRHLEDQSSNSIFKELSAGHKMVLSIVTCCVDLLAERSIVLLDEPETHLHAPLLASMLRALSNIMVKRNALAVISTHSPIVLQEVPKSCVWLLDRKLPV